MVDAKRKKEIEDQWNTPFGTFIMIVLVVGVTLAVGIAIFGAIFGDDDGGGDNDFTRTRDSIADEICKDPANRSYINDWDEKCG